MSPAEEKRRNGQFFTHGNPFQHKVFLWWSELANIARETILEPFAGANSLIEHLEHMDLCADFQSFDISPSSKRVKKKDTLENFPRGFNVCVTNPPWLAKNSATVRGFEFPDCSYDDLYKFALSKCLDYCRWIAALVPESFICANLFRERLIGFISLTPDIFADTGHPVGLALFGPSKGKRTDVWYGDSHIGNLESIEALRPKPTEDGPGVTFNDPDGNVGLYALDNTREASIRFCPIDELSDYEVKGSGRHITKMTVEGEIRIDDWNSFIADFRNQTKDVLMTSYKGIRKDGMYRRRLDWSLARGIIHNARTA